MMRFVNLFTFWVKDEKKREHLNHFLGFAIVGVAMTLVTLVLNFLFLKVLDFQLIASYIIVGILTIFFSYLLNTFYVFKQHFSLITLLVYYAIYLSGMIIGIPLLKLFEFILPIDFFAPFLQPYRKFLISAMPIPITLIWNYILTSFVMKNKKIAGMLRPVK
jgi:putative flippase GtrA